MTTTTPALKRRFEHDVLVNILNAINESIGKGTEYNNNLIDDPGASLAKIVTMTRLSYPQTKQYLQLLADQGLITITAYQRKRAHKKRSEVKRQSTVTTVKVTDKGYKYLQQEEEQYKRRTT
jgi:predicted transcriptional regulator